MGSKEGTKAAQLYIRALASWKAYLHVCLDKPAWLVCLFVLVFTEGAITKVDFENKALRHNAASQV
jgi:hypothetical protein